MYKNSKQKNHDPALQALALLEQENRRFENHWVWRKLGCRPEQFFRALEKHVASLNIPKRQWEAALKKARDLSRVRAKEKQTMFHPQSLASLAGIQV